jgi:hypothetical protein
LRRHGYCELQGIMNPEETAGVVEPKNPTTARVNGTPPTASREFARRARTVIFELPSTLDARMKGSPYKTLGAAFAVGMGAGILLGSRILRSLAVSVVSYAVVELGRAYLRDAVTGGPAAAR